MSGYSPPPPPPPGSAPPAGSPPPPGWQPAPPQAPPPPPAGFYGAPVYSGYAPQPAHHGGRSIAIIFIAGIAIFAAVGIGIVLMLQPPPPAEQCREGEACNPPAQPTLPADPGTSPVAVVTPTPASTATSGPGETPTPGPTATPVGPGPTPTGSPPIGPTPTPGPVSSAPPHVGGTVWTSSTLGYSFEYDADDWRLLDEDEDYAELGLGPANFIVLGFPGTTGVAAAMADVTGRLDNFILGRTPNTRSYDALLGPSIGYIRGEGAVYSGTFRNADGTPGEAAGITILGSTDGRVTVVIAVLVSGPDRPLGGDTIQAIVRSYGDEILKTFDWGTGQ